MIYLVSPLSSDRLNRHAAPYALVVTAASVADARAICKDYRSGSVSPAAWDAATVTQLQDTLLNAANVLSGAELDLCLKGAPNTFNVRAAPTKIVGSATIAAGGTGYSADDILTLAGGSAARLATFKVLTVSGGVVTSVGLVDGGDYTTIPIGTQTTTVAPAGGTGCTLTTITEETDSLAALLSDAVTKLNSRADVAGALVDMSATNPLLTVTGVVDALGDKELLVNFLPAKLFDANNFQLSTRQAIPDIIDTVTDQGIAAAAVTVAFADPSIYAYPSVFQVA